MGSVTVERITVEMIRWQVDLLGYVRCGDHVNESRGGDISEREAREVLRSSECDDPGLWTCDICLRLVGNWPRHHKVVSAVIEHTPARIF